MESATRRCRASGPRYSPWVERPRLSRYAERASERRAASSRYLSKLLRGFLPPASESCEGSFSGGRNIIAKGREAARITFSVPSRAGHDQIGIWEAIAIAPR
jgi:hypothetical protein